jgi:hypothetical protein
VARPKSVKALKRMARVLEGMQRRKATELAIAAMKNELQRGNARK